MPSCAGSGQGTRSFERTSPGWVGRRSSREPRRRRETGFTRAAISSRPWLRSGPLPAGLPHARLRATEADLAVAREWLAARGIGSAEAVVLQPGAGSAAKVWPGFAALARRLRAGGVPLVALAGPADGPAVEALLEDGALQEETLARDWPLPEIAALLSLARAVVGNDSGPTHLAAAVGCPTVALFGPTDPAVWAPAGAHVRVVARPAGGAPWADVERVVAALGPVLAAPVVAAVGDPVRAGGGPA